MGLFRKTKKDYIQLEIKKLIEWDEPNGEGCIVSDKITKEGYKVGYMRRDVSNPNYPDSGWRFMAGNEDDAYMSDPDNHHVFALNTICNFDPDIIPFLHSPAGSAFIRDIDGRIVADDGIKEICIVKR